jgi:hypothetical protein
MRTGVYAQHPPRAPASSGLARPNGTSAGPRRGAEPAGGSQSASPGHDFRRISVHPLAAGATRAEAAAVPSSVHDILRSAGRPLDPDTRAFMEPRFGHDFSRVRVHADATAAESARTLSADAYTVGRDIVFGAGQFAPGTPSGQRLLSHELTHVVQQRRASAPVARGVSVAGEFHERQAGVVADAVMQGGDVAGLLDADAGPARPALQRQPAPGTQASPPRPAAAPPPLPQPLDYDRAPYLLDLLDPGQTAANVTTLLQKKIRDGEIASFAVQGVRAGSNAEIFLLAAVHRLGTRSRRGTETDIVTAIDWPARPGGPAPQGRVTVRIDARGAASAELVAAGPVPAVAQMTAADGRAKLTADFGFTAVTGWSGHDPRKDAAEISDVVAALALLKARAPQDVAALAGVELIRVPSLGGDTGGEFSLGGAAPSGSTIPAKPFLKLADRAFEGADTQFFGGGPGTPTVPASFQTILHEVGHAVEKEEFRKAREGVLRAMAELDAAKERSKANNATYDARLQEAQRTRKVGAFYKKEEATYKKLQDAETKASANIAAEDAKVDQTKVTASTIAPLETSAAALATSAADLLTAAKATVQALSAAEVQSSAAYLRGIEATGAAITSFAVDTKAGNGVVEDLAVVAAQTAFDRDRASFASLRTGPVNGRVNRAIAPLTRVADAQDIWFDAEHVLARARSRTLRLQKFVDLVAANNIRPFTKYAAANWKLKPDEFYAEAYSLWLVDAEFLKTNYKPVYDFFQNGDYRK